MEANFKIGQKVYATYHHTFNIDRPKVATVICKLFNRKHHFSGIKYGNSQTGKCKWYLIICKGNLLPSIFPETCLDDCKEYATKMRSSLENHADRIGQPGFSKESYMDLMNGVKECENA